MSEHASSPEWIAPVASSLLDRLEQQVREQRLPGLAVGIVSDDELVWFQAFGAADIVTARPIHADTLFRVASITKTFTATGILQLRDAGKLELDDPLVKHLPEFAAEYGDQNPTRRITLKQLLSHHSGLTTEAPGPCWDGCLFPTHEELRAMLPRLEQVIPPDGDFKYSNLAFGLLGEVIHRVTGEDALAYLTRAILQPLGMTSSTFEPDDQQRTRLAVGYLPDLFSDHLRPAPELPLNAIAACGGLCASPRDLARWIGAQVRMQGNPVLSAESLQESQRPVYLEADWSLGHCIGWRASRSGSHVYHGHGGGIFGFASQILHHTPTHLGAICLTNVWPHPGLLPMATEILDTLLAARPAPSKPSLSPATRMSNDELQRYVGLYIAPVGVPVQIELCSGTLRIVKSPLSAYSLHAPAELIATDDPLRLKVIGGRGAGETAEFTTDANGQINRFSLGGFVFHKSSIA